MKVKLTREMFIRAAEECEQINERTWDDRVGLHLSCSSPYSCDVIGYVVAAEVGLPRLNAYRQTQPIRDLYSKWMSPDCAPAWSFWLDGEVQDHFAAKTLRPMLLLFAGEVLNGTEIEL